MITCGIIFCGGCNPLINRANVTRCVQQAIPNWAFKYLYPDESVSNVDVILIINGCHAGCMRADDDWGKPSVTVCGTAINFRTVPRDKLCFKLCAELQRIVEEHYGKLESRIQSETTTSR